MKAARGSNRLQSRWLAVYADVKVTAPPDRRQPLPPDFPWLRGDGVGGRGVALNGTQVYDRCGSLAGVITFENEVLEVVN